ncbi:hypothetical protein SIXOD_v1c01240 [Spiroplasma ixodetis Y32]|nr:hypothetical protein SIXOD_v1c01240 [Spiroplasma ixodetis Y32]
MRIIPYELFSYTPDMSLTALRKELLMYDHCLNKKITNMAMQPFLDLERNYFNLLLCKWELEMQKRNHYVNSLFKCYTKYNDFEFVATPDFLIIECCIQWDLKGFQPYKCNLNWFEIMMMTIKNKDKINKDFYEQLSLWYKEMFMKINNNGSFKPKKLNMNIVFEKINNFLLTA